jgi:uncharacterized membrane protein
MDTFRIAVLVAATLATGLNAGLYYTYACSIMVTLRGVDDRTFVNMMQRINRDITNGWFFLTFMGALLVPALALILFIGVNGAVVLPVAIGLGLYVVSFGITMGVNVPMNNRMDKVGDPDTMSPQALAEARRVFEKPWVRSNLNRTLASTGSCGALCWALLTL